MKKTAIAPALLPTIILLFTISLTSCFSIPKTFKLVIDENIPAEQNAFITFVNNISRGYFYVKEWNGIDVTTSVYGEKLKWSSNDKVLLTVPAGENRIAFDVRYTFSNQYSSYTYKFDDMEIKYDLESGKKYQVKGRYKSLGLFKGYEFFIGIYDTAKGSVLLKEWKIGES